jgi:imidazolonepropionase-like amidohydrolase
MHLDRNYVSASFLSKGEEGFIRITAQLMPDRKWKGEVQAPKGIIVPFEAILTEPYTEAEKDEDEILKQAEEEKLRYTIGESWFPDMAYGWTKEELTAAGNKKYLVRNATVWTNEQEGILHDYDVLLEGGKISRIGKNLDENGCEVIDGTGMHLTSGIIDEHSHIALTRGVNEGTQSSSAEVRMSDVVTGDDINIYRQLSGGVTVAQLLHGSANAIGGQSALIKLRWGQPAGELLFENAPGFIKFALGENVKQSNWGPGYTTRYPQTRMGVEQFYYEMFRQAKEYARKKKTEKGPVRKDLELETLLEILDGKRFITCHSYVQSEVNMLMHVADSIGFRVNTFTHILEGYKVAGKMRSRGINASTFSDWWAYKMEVMEAIPYNAFILTRAGVNTAINSDDAEMARRLNQEAAKLVKYGGLTQEEAWKTVTLNPAKMLHIDNRVGSIKTGKDADVVLWSDNPLSIYARVITTWVDGVIRFDEKRDELLQQRIATERNRILQKMLKAKKEGEQTAPVTKKQPLLYHCDDTEDEIQQLILISNQ